MLFFKGIQTTSPPMKSFICNLFTLVTFASFFSSCAMKKEDPQQELIYNCMPDSREICLKYGTHGEYSYRIYAHGVQLQALSPNISVTYAEVWDVDHDGKLESVWAQDRGKWRHSSLIDHPILSKDPDPMFLTNFIGLGNQIRSQTEKEEPEGFVRVF